MQDDAEHHNTGRRHRPRVPAERLPELFGAQFYRFLPGLDASRRSETQGSPSSMTESSAVGSADSRQLYSVHLPSLTSASSMMAGSEGGALAAHSVESRLLLKGQYAESAASGSEADKIHPSSRAMLAIRRSRILGMPLTYYALLMGSMVLCAFSYSYASKTMRQRSVAFPGHDHVTAKKGQGALLNVPVLQPSSKGQDLAYTAGPGEPPSVRVHSSSRRRHAKHSGRKSKRSERRFKSTVATAAATTVAADDTDLTPETMPSATGQPRVMETTPSAADVTVATTFAPASPPPAPNVTSGDIPQNGTFNSSANLDEYEEVFEYYYVYDDNETSTSSTLQPAQYAELAIPINR